MRHFTVIVSDFGTQVFEQIKPLRRYNFRATVDGDNWLYQIKKEKNNTQSRQIWLGRGTQTVHYHAHNSGTVVRFSPVQHTKRRKRTIDDKQMSLW